MREILYKNLTSAKKGRRAISVCERSQGKDCSTRVQRTFVYLVRSGVLSRKELPQPVFHIVKTFNTKTRTERFYFRMKGISYVVQNDCFLEVSFCHSLRIDVIPKLVPQSR
ncbi:MAG TPA: hypothetical protein PL155_05690 [Candidatus Omnitrophota bacterium]|nr:hypothetical protein [Candidatus Omnitrophota bacterium]HPD84029.1 hypothetical protein [Candidatus Omnitrophota bacterium]HRZ02886.1 hypothetical protein [Candidatus Omnitrophota bacterium]